MQKIGLLLPRSTDYPSMGFDMLEGLRSQLAMAGRQNISVVTDNIGFGEDAAKNYEKAEKMILEQEADIIVCYSNPSNAEGLYSLAKSSGKPFVFLDAGMQLPGINPEENCYHISLQGVLSCVLGGEYAAAGGKKVLMATSFYDGGYRGPWGYHNSIENSGGSICGNYISTYREAEFSITDYLSLLENTNAQGIAACFSSYLAILFMQSLKEAGAGAVKVPFYCSPYMAEEQILAKCEFPGGEFHVFVPWSSLLENEQQEIFVNTLQSKNKQATVFHLLGWEAAIIAGRLAETNNASLKNWSYESPRGTVTINSTTNYTFAPVYYGAIVAGENGKCAFKVKEKIDISAELHTRYVSDVEQRVSSGWRNNYLCI